MFEIYDDVLRATTCFMAYFTMNQPEVLDIPSKARKGLYMKQHK
jgi:hypothetical protein